MSAPGVFTIATGRCTSIGSASDFRYPSETEPHSYSAFVDLNETGILSLKGKPAQIFERSADGKYTRVRAEVVQKSDKTGNFKSIGTGIISDGYAAKLVDQIKSGHNLVARRFQPKKTLTEVTGFLTNRCRGDVFPVSYFAKLECIKSGLNDGHSVRDKIRICGQVMRGFLKRCEPIRLRVKRGIGSERATVPILAHNLVVAPHPTVLDQIRQQGLPIDALLEQAARHAIEVLERKSGAKILAFGGLHLEDSTRIRPHLHLRLAAYDSNGSYVALFDRKKGSMAGNRVVFQEEIERQLFRQINRLERMEPKYDRLS